MRPDGGVLFLPGGPTGAVEPGGGPGFAVVALTAAGQLDGSLAGDGSAQWFGALWDLRTSPYAGDLAVASDGRVLVGGGLTEGHRARILLAMRRADGGPARSFGRGGFLVSRTPPGLTGEGGATALAFGPHHRAYVAGRVGGDLVLARYLLG